MFNLTILGVVIQIVRIIEINKGQEFISLKKIWINLVNLYEINNIFLTWEWISTWWKYFGDKKELCILLIEDKNEIVFIAPLMKSNFFINKLNMNKIEFIGNPDSDYSGFISSHNYQKYFPIFLKHLIKKYSKQYYFVFRDIPEDVLHLTYINQTIKIFKNINTKKIVKCPYLKLPHKYDDFYMNLKSKFKKNLRYREKKLEKIGKIKYQSYKSLGSITNTMKHLFYLNKIRYKQIEKISYFERPKKMDFHLEISQLFAKKNWLNLGFLTINNIPVAAEYSFNFRNKTFAYQSGFDPNYSKYGVGRLCELYHIKSSIQEGVRIYDWTRGYEDYIKSWTSSYKYNYEISYFKNKFLYKIYKRKLLFENMLKKAGRLTPLKVRSYFHTYK